MKIQLKIVVIDKRPIPQYNINYNHALINNQIDKILSRFTDKGFHKKPTLAIVNDIL